MSSCKVGNQTNSQDPQAVNSRVFVGNLNTFQCSKTDVERRFQRYGRIAGISMHKGYAFIQFTNPFDARSACLGENGRLLWGQTLDVNLVAEPKAHQTGRKRQNIAKTGNDWDYYYDSYYAQMGLQTPRLIPPMKRPRIHVPPNPYASVPVPSPTTMSNMVNSAIFHNTNTSIAQIQQQQLQQQINHQQQQQQQQIQQQRRVNHNNNNHKGSSSNSHNHNQHKSSAASSPVSNVSISELKTYSTPDILICGNCRELFSEIEQLMQHKQNYCKLRFTCKCHMLNGCQPRVPGEEPASLLCSQCKDSFQSAWDLMVHVQTAHLINIYQLGMESSSSDQDNEHHEQSEPNVGSPNNLLTLALLGSGGNGGSATNSSNGDPQSSSAMLTNEVDDGNHKCDTSCQTTSSYLVETNNNINHEASSPAAGEELLNSGIIIQQPMSSGSSSSSISTSTYTDGLLEGLMTNCSNSVGNGVVITAEDDDDGEGTVPRLNGLSPKEHEQEQSVRINGILNNNTGIFPKETTTQTLGCQTDQQMMTSTNDLDDQQDCSTTMLSAIKVEDGTHVVKYVTGRV